MLKTSTVTTPNNTTNRHKINSPSAFSGFPGVGKTAHIAINSSQSLDHFLRFSGLFKKNDITIPTSYQALPSILLQTIDLTPDHPLIKVVNQKFKNKEERESIEEDLCALLQGIALKDITFIRKQPDQIRKLVAEILPMVIDQSSSKSALQLVSSLIVESAQQKDIPKVISFLEIVYKEQPEVQILLKWLAKNQQNADIQNRELLNMVSILIENQDQLGLLSNNRIDTFIEIWGSEEGKESSHWQDDLNTLLLFTLLPISEHEWVTRADELILEKDPLRRNTLIKKHLTESLFNLPEKQHHFRGLVLKENQDLETPLSIKKHLDSSTTLSSDRRNSLNTLLKTLLIQPYDPSTQEVFRLLEESPLDDNAFSKVLSYMTASVDAGHRFSLQTLYIAVLLIAPEIDASQHALWLEDILSSIETWQLDRFLKQLSNLSDINLFDTARKAILFTETTQPQLSKELKVCLDSNDRHKIAAYLRGNTERIQSEAMPILLAEKALLDFFTTLNSNNPNHNLFIKTVLNKLSNHQGTLETSQLVDLVLQTSLEFPDSIPNPEHIFQKFYGSHQSASLIYDFLKKEGDSFGAKKEGITKLAKKLIQSKDLTQKNVDCLILLSQLNLQQEKWDKIVISAQILIERGVSQFNFENIGNITLPFMKEISPVWRQELFEKASENKEIVLNFNDVYGFDNAPQNSENSQLLTDILTLSQQFVPNQSTTFVNLLLNLLKEINDTLWLKLVSDHLDRMKDTEKLELNVLFENLLPYADHISASWFKQLLESMPPPKVLYSLLYDIKSNSSLSDSEKQLRAEFVRSLDSKTLEAPNLRVQLMSFSLMPTLDPNVVNDKGDTMAHWAIKNKDLKLLKALLALSSLDPNIKNKDGRTIGYLAVQHNEPEIFDKILAHRLLEADERTRLRSVSLLLQDNMAPLHQAIAQKNQDPLLEILPFLLLTYPVKVLHEMFRRLESHMDHHTNARGSHPNIAEFLLLLNHPELKDRDPSKIGRLTTGITSITRFTRSLSELTVSAWQNIGLLTHSFKYWRFDTQGTDSLFNRFGFETISDEKEHDFGKGYSFNPISTFDVQMRSNLDSDTRVVFRRGFLVVTHPDNGTLIIRNSSKVFGRNLLGYPAYYSPLTLTEQELKDLQPTAKELAQKSFNHILVPELYSRSKPIDNALWFLSNELMLLKNDYKSWKFNPDGFLVDLTTQNEDFSLALSEGFIQMCHLLNTMQAQNKALPVLGFVNPDYPVFEPISSLQMTPELLLDLNKMIEGDWNVDPSLIQLIQDGLDRYGEPILMKPD